MLEIVYILAFCVVVLYLAKRMDAAPEAAAATVPEGRQALHPLTEGRQATHPITETAVATQTKWKLRSAVSARGAIRVGGAVGARTTSNGIGMRAATGAVGARATTNGVGVRTATGAVGVRAATGAVGVRGASGPGGLGAAAPSYYITTVENKKTDLWLAMPDESIIDYAKPVFQRRPATRDNRFRWRYVEIYPGMHVIANVDSGRVLQYCGYDILCLQMPLSEVQGRIKSETHVDDDMIFTADTMEPNADPVLYTIAARRDQSLLVYSQPKDARVTPYWGARTQDSALWLFEEAP